MSDNPPLSRTLESGEYYIVLPNLVDDEAKQTFRFSDCYVCSGDCGFGDNGRATRNMLQEIDLVTPMLMGVTSMTFRMIHWNGGKSHGILVGGAHGTQQVTTLENHLRTTGLWQRTFRATWN